jgi:hypothetical protein
LDDNIKTYRGASNVLVEAQETSQLTQGFGRGTLMQRSNDSSLELLYVRDAGNVYQKLLTLMLTALMVQSCNQDSLPTSDSVSEEEYKYRAERLKWEVWHSTNGDISKTCFGISSVEPLHYLPIKATMPDGELLQI